MSEHPGESADLSADTRFGRFVRRLSGTLESARPADAVRLFMDGLSHEVIADRPDLAPYLVRKLGKERTLKLTRAFAHRPCDYCRHGLERCDACDGRGYHRDYAVCERCMGLGLAPCDFCTGTGWVTYNFIPAGLRLAVILERAKSAVREIESVLRRPPPVTPGAATKEHRRALARELVHINRLLGILENAVTAGRKLTAFDAHAEPGVRKLAKTCVRASRRLLPRLHTLLRGLSELSRSASERASKPAARAIAARRLKYYELLAASDDFVGSALHHPHLRIEPPQRESDPMADPPHGPAEEPPG